MSDIEDALKILAESGIPAHRRDYGFSLDHPERSKRTFAECGMDNDSSISLSVNIDESPPVQWFFRISYTEMAHFIAEAYAFTGTADPSRASLVASMRHLDKSYDRGPLDKMTEQFLSSF